MGLLKVGTGSPNSATVTGKVYAQNSRFGLGECGRLAWVRGQLFYRSGGSEDGRVVTLQLLDPLSLQARSGRAVRERIRTRPARGAAPALPPSLPDAPSRR